MKIPWWMYIAVGIIISIVSGYVYKNVPKNGEPNMAMAFFFFIGMVFILVGVVKVFFRKLESSEPMVIEKTFEKNPAAMTKSEQAAHINRVEQHINKIYQQQNKPSQESHAQHTSSYAATHSYHDMKPAHPSNIAPQHPQHQTQQHTAHHVSQYVQCRKCGKNNHPGANYCHNCGYRLK